MIKTLTVLLYGKPIGRLMLEEDGYSSFEYLPEFCRSTLQPSPLLMPAEEGRIYKFPSLGRETYNGLPGMIADSLPDSFGQALLNQWLVANHRSENSANALEKLSFQGKRCMGALEYEPSRDTSLEESSLVEMTELVEAAREALQKKESFSTCLNQNKKAVMEILKMGTSAGGQRAKAVIALNDKTGEIRSGQVAAPEGFDYWLLKFDGFDSNGHTTDPTDFGRIEYAFSKCIHEAGIEMSECRLYEECGRAHFMTKRFDRVDGNKVHMQTLCAMAHYDFRMAGAYSYEQAFNVLRMLGMDYSQSQELYRRMVFNVMCANMDDHTKNISFLMDRRGRWRLAPAYDMATCYNPEGQWTSSHQMTICGKRNNITKEDMVKFAQMQDVLHPEEIIDTAYSAIMNFPEYAREAGVKEEEITRIMCIFERFNNGV